MNSHKTIKLLGDDTLLFTFHTDIVTVDIHTSNNYITLSKDHSEFNNLLSELKNDLNISEHKTKLIWYWFRKNSKKIFPTTPYVTKYGRKINYNQLDQS